MGRIHVVVQSHGRQGRHRPAAAWSEVAAELGFLFAHLAHTVENEIERYLDKEFGKRK